MTNILDRRAFLLGTTSFGALFALPLPTIAAAPGFDGLLLLDGWICRAEDLDRPLPLAAYSLSERVQTA